MFEELANGATDGHADGGDDEADAKDGTKGNDTGPAAGQPPVVVVVEKGAAAAGHDGGDEGEDQLTGMPAPAAANLAVESRTSGHGRTNSELLRSLSQISFDAETNV